MNPPQTDATQDNSPRPVHVGLQWLIWFILASKHQVPPTLYIVISPPERVRIVVMSISVCLSVCLSVHPQLNNRAAEFHQIFGACCQWPWRSDGVTIRYVMYFRFYGWRRWGQWQTSTTVDDHSVWLSSSQCGTRSEVCSLLLTCIVLLHYVRWYLIDPTRSRTV